VSALEVALRRVVSLLDEAGAPCALIGGLAVSVRLEPRFTRDVDLAVAAATDADAEALVQRLLTAGCTVISTVEQAAVGRLATVRLLTEPVDGPVVDLLFASSGIEAEVVARAERLEVLEGLEIPVATTPDLIALKLLSRDDDDRPQDLVDLRGLIAQASDADLAEVRRATALITSRGFHRGRDLDAELGRVRPIR
jgi:predicted nucleotidyltransferase